MLYRDISVKSFERAWELSKSSSQEWYVRYMRANTYCQFPLSLGKAEIAESDFDFVDSYISKNPSLEPYLIAIYYYRGSLKQKKRDLPAARNLWLRSLQIQGKLSFPVREANLSRKCLDQYDPVDKPR
jgi:hypothetical protein